MDRYVGDLLVAPDAALEAAAASGLPAHEVSPPQGKLLQLLARTVRARRILELGTLGAYSTIWLARALPASGRLVTLEADSQHAEVARANIERAGLDAVVELMVGPALDIVPRLRGPFDFVFIDADTGGLIVADNVVRDGELANASSDDPSVRGVQRFHELLAADPRVDATTIQTVGQKGYDGFSIALVSGYQNEADSMASSSSSSGLV